MKKEIPDHFEIMKEEFELKFMQSWNKDPDLFVKYYQVRVLDALFISLKSEIKEIRNLLEKKK